MENSTSPYYVYVLYSIKLEQFYIGQTLDVEQRLIEHNRKESSYTSFGVPWKLLWVTTKNHFRDSEDLERKLKNLSRLRKIKFMRKYKEGIVNIELLSRIKP